MGTEAWATRSDNDLPWAERYINELVWARGHGQRHRSMTCHGRDTTMAHHGRRDPTMTPKGHKSVQINDLTWAQSHVVKKDSNPPRARSGG